MTLEDKIAESVAAAVKSLYGLEVAPADVQLQQTRKEFEGNLTVVVFPYVKAARKAPAAVADEIGRFLTDNDPAVARFNAVNGFLNLVIEPTYWNSVLARVASTPGWGVTEPTPESPLVMVEYSSPNTNKPLHLGHLRNILLGHSLCKILAANGNRVVRTNIVNDRGIHICKSMLAWRKWGQGATPESTGKKGDHLIGDFYVLFDKHYKAELNDLKASGMTDSEAEAASTLMAEAREMLRKWEAGDPETLELWRTMNQWVYDGFDVTYANLGVGFDKIYYESNTYLQGKEKVLEGLEKGLFERHDDGSVWATFPDSAIDPKLLLRSDGTSLYMTQDIGTAKLRFDDYPIDKMVYVVGNEQEHHFKVLSLLLDRLGFKWGKDLVHFSYGMVNLPNGRMKSREGTVVDADDLIAEMVASALRVGDETGHLDGLSEQEKTEIATTVGLGALKYFLLKVDPRKNMTFNPEESIDFNGNTGPFIQYTHARIRSLLRKAAEAGYAESDLVKAPAPNERETVLIQRLADFPETVSTAGRNFSPDTVAKYAYDLVKEYNQFYHDCPVLNEQDPERRAFRLTLSRAVADTVATAMDLLGIRVPDRM